MLVPAFFGITLSNIVVSTSALLSAVVLPLTEAIKLASVCKHFGESPYALEAGVLVSYAPVSMERSRASPSFLEKLEKGCLLYMHCYLTLSF